MRRNDTHCRTFWWWSFGDTGSFLEYDYDTMNYDSFQEIASQNAADLYHVGHSRRPPNLLLSTVPGTTVDYCTMHDTQAAPLVGGLDLTDSRGRSHSSSVYVLPDQVIRGYGVILGLR
jgi:hypothetical protein